MKAIVIESMTGGKSDRAAMALETLSKPSLSRRIPSKDAPVRAVGSLFDQGGVHTMGVNALIEEAGFGKMQIKVYFGLCAATNDCVMQRKLAA